MERAVCRTCVLADKLSWDEARKPVQAHVRTDLSVLDQVPAPARARGVALVRKNVYILEATRDRHRLGRVLVPSGTLVVALVLVRPVEARAIRALGETGFLVLQVVPVPGGTDGVARPRAGDLVRVLTLAGVAADARAVHVAVFWKFCAQASPFTNGVFAGHGPAALRSGRERCRLYEEGPALVATRRFHVSSEIFFPGAGFRFSLNTC